MRQPKAVQESQVSPLSNSMFFSFLLERPNSLTARQRESTSLSTLADCTSRSVIHRGFETRRRIAGVELERTSALSERDIVMAVEADGSDGHGYISKRGEYPSTSGRVSGGRNISVRNIYIILLDLVAERRIGLIEPTLHVLWENVSIRVASFAI